MKIKVFGLGDRKFAGTSEQIVEKMRLNTEGWAKSKSNDLEEYMKIICRRTGHRIRFFGENDSERCRTFIESLINCGYAERLE